MKTRNILIISLMVLALSACGRKERKLAEADLINEISTTPVLYTEKARVEVIVTETDKPDSWKKMFGERTIIVPVSANVKAGIDLSKIQQIKVEGNTVYITLPEPLIEIESTEVKNGEVVTNVSFFRDYFTEEEKSRIALKGRDRIASTIARLDLVRTAQERARQILTDMAAAAGYEAVIEVPKYGEKDILRIIRK